MVIRGTMAPPPGETAAVEMHQIRYFLAVCETLNFTRAAEACNVSQPSLTRAVKGLEDELGGPLFRRERNNTHLTGLGEMMRPHLIRVLIETDAAKERAKSFARLEDVELKLGMMCTIGPRRFVPFLKGFRERHPSVKLVVQDGSNEQIQERLAQGQLDVAIYGQPEEIDERFHARRLYDERFVIGVAPGHEFEKQNVVQAKDLHGKAYVNRQQCEFFGHAGRIFREHDGKPSIVFRSDRDDWVQSMVLAGLGFTFIAEYAVTAPGLCVRPLIDPEISRTIQVVTVRGRPHVPSVSAFVREVLAFPWANATN
jgi:LysR family transcriptional regulator, hydrogen peroxide-inducible genes activator